MTANTRNLGIATGRLTREANIYENKDGSHKVKLTVAVKDNFKSKGEFGTQFVPVEAFVPKDSKILPVYEGLAKGDLVSVSYSVVTPEPYTDKNGVTQYPVVLQIQSIDTTLEPKSAKDGRQLAQAVAAEDLDA